MIISSIFFIGKTSAAYGSIAFGFSMLGLILPGTFLVGNPLEVSGVSIEHITGHIMWGLAAGIVSFSFRYAILSGLFPIILDFDHWIQFFGIEMIPRMAHSITFGFIAIGIMMIIFDRKDLRLGAISIAAVFSHISFDIFLSGTSEFPIFVPFSSQSFIFSGTDWIVFEFLAIAIIFVASVIVLRKQKIKKNEY
ncbi:hypothetical protein [Nitrosopumilus sp. b2]|uniref:hypothetical protein n=1 Tax=Nitrosopumilus sp. b2 TaxID=2109908 RepID=UPI0015F3FDA7|nr:hypothetical protein [Nitrosopumilus sp. b2]KAF6245744.1 hypothetical protein C6989_00990 [Nitrosopumilus sp. b2]